MEDYPEKSKEAYMKNLIGLSEIAEQQGDLAKAAALLSTAFLLSNGLDMDHIQDSLVGLAQNLLADEDTSVALLIFNLIRAVYGEDSEEVLPHAHFHAGEALIALGEPEYGEVLLKRGYQYDSSNDHFARAIGNFLLKRGKYAESVKYFEEALEEQTDDGDIHEIIKSIALAKQNQNQRDEVLIYFLDQFEAWHIEGLLMDAISFASKMDEAARIIMFDEIMARIRGMDETISEWGGGGPKYILLFSLEHASNDSPSIRKKRRNPG